MDNDVPKKVIDTSKIKLKKPDGIVGASPTHAMPGAGELVPMANKKAKLPSRGQFPDQPRSGNTPPMTLANLRHLLAHYGVIVRYNLIKKELEIRVPGVYGTTENAANSAMTHILNLVAMNEMSVGMVTEFVAAIGDENAYNPAADWINSLPWDGVDRLTAFYDTVIAVDGYPTFFKTVLIKKWALSIVAAALIPRGFRSRGVLTFQGPQGIGKTSWVRRLISDPHLQEELIKTDHHMDGGDKDSRISAIKHLIVEIGELDSSFKKDVARLKGFLTNDTDKIRRPYHRTDSEYPRRTVFIATVNDPYFLVDTTGNSRWWTISVESLDYSHGIDMQQLYAQLAVELAAGAQWWLNSDEEAQLEYRNSHHQAVSVLRDKVSAYIDPSLRDEQGLTAMTPTELLEELGFKYPTNPQARECGSILRELLGPSKRIQGRDKWRIPIRSDDPDGWIPTANPDPTGFD